MCCACTLASAQSTLCNDTTHILLGIRKNYVRELSRCQEFSLLADIFRFMKSAIACRFYQHVQGGSAWDWKIVWAHASSSDLVHWQHEPMALQPTPGGLDGQGCWSGNTMIAEDGTPTILYTMVRSVGSCSPAQGNGCSIMCLLRMAIRPFCTPWSGQLALDLLPRGTWGAAVTSSAF